MRKAPTFLLCLTLLSGCHNSSETSLQSFVEPLEAVKVEEELLQVEAEREALLALSDGGQARLAPDTQLRFQKTADGLVDPLSLELIRGRMLLKSRGAFSILGPDNLSLQGGQGLFVVQSGESSLNFQALEGNAQKVTQGAPSTLREDFQNWYPLSPGNFQLSTFPQTSPVTKWPWVHVPTDPDNLGPSQQVPGFSSP